MTPQFTVSAQCVSLHGSSAKTLSVFMVWFGFAANLNIVSWLLQNELGWVC